MKAHEVTQKEHPGQQAEKKTTAFNEHDVVHDLKHYLPAQAPLKDFIHHNTLHAFQQQKFYSAITHASRIFGYQLSLSLDEYRASYKTGRIRNDVLEKIIIERKGAEQLGLWKNRMVHEEYSQPDLPRIGSLRLNWKKHYQIDLDSMVHPILFRVLCSYLDQGISIWNFPVLHKGFLSSLRELERNSFTSFFRTERARKLLLDRETNLSDLLKLLLEDESLFKHYLFDQQFAHQGWAGMVSTIEDHPETLLDRKKISLHDVIVFETLLEIDALDFHFRGNWEPLGRKVDVVSSDLFADVEQTERDEVLLLWQDAYEWSYYDDVLAGLQQNKSENTKLEEKSFQAMFCIDDRECSFRRYLEQTDPHSETFGTPGYFNVEFFFKPAHGKFYTKLCPAPINPKYLIKEVGSRGRHAKDVHFTKRSHTLLWGWLVTQTLGFWSAFKLFVNIFKPSATPATASSFDHMDKIAKLTIACSNPERHENHLQVGFTVEEMAARAEGLLKSIGLVDEFASLVYIMGHGSSTVNNPHYAAYDCGACSGRPGSVNARVMCHMLNDERVREILRDRGIDIPSTTKFIGGLHDTTRDEVTFYDEHSLPPDLLEKHQRNEETFKKALDLNAKERSRRFRNIDTQQNAQAIHQKIRERSVSLFEPRPELNHATNSLCIVGRRSLTDHLFLDRRSFMNSFDYKIDPEGKYLFNILSAAAPVCGGINLEYFFSRVDNQKLGAGTKLPHNVMGLFGVANGIDGDLRPGLPSQMIEVHDPVRLLLVVEHFPEVVLKTIQQSAETYEWFINDWIHLVTVHPETKAFAVLKDGAFVSYEPLQKKVQRVVDITPFIETEEENIPVCLIP